MPTILLKYGLRFYFLSNENNEPAHIHVEKAEANGKIWLEPYKIEYFYGFTKNEQKQIINLVKDNLELFKSKWNEYFK